MDFIGTQGWPAPRLQDVEISESKARELYWDLSLIIRNIYHQCKLVHGDLSEFNLLYHEGKAYVIDVSQSVEHDHPHALEFLRKDIHNVTEFFRKKGVNVLTVKELFDYVVDPTIEVANQEIALEDLNAKASSRTDAERTAQELVEEAVFKQIFIPRQLIEVTYPERELSGLKSGAKTETDLVYKSVTGVQLPKKCEDEGEASNEDSDESDEEQIEQEGDEKTEFKSSHRPRDESPNSKKARKQAVKAEKAEKRKDKVKKHVKKRKEKQSASKKKWTIVLYKSYMA